MAEHSNPVRHTSASMPYHRRMVMAPQPLVVSRARTKLAAPGQMCSIAPTIFVGASSDSCTDECYSDNRRSGAAAEAGWTGVAAPVQAIAFIRECTIADRHPWGLVQCHLKSLRLQHGEEAGVWARVNYGRSQGGA